MKNDTPLVGATIHACKESLPPAAEIFGTFPGAILIDVAKASAKVLACHVLRLVDFSDGKDPAARGAIAT